MGKEEGFGHVIEGGVKYWHKECSAPQLHLYSATITTYVSKHFTKDIHVIAYIYLNLTTISFHFR